nr:hypothetical protein [Bacilli bacterium]
NSKYLAYQSIYMDGNNTLLVTSNTSLDNLISLSTSLALTPNKIYDLYYLVDVNDVDTYDSLNLYFEECMGNEGAFDYRYGTSYSEYGDYVSLHYIYECI